MHDFRRVGPMRSHVAAVALVLALAGCGGGGGVSSTPTPTPAPSPTPTPAPTATPTPTSVNFDTAEYRRSDGPALHGAITAWQAGASGKGTTIAIIDSGIDTGSPEFSGRISALSEDVVGNRSLANPDDDHGNQVALIAAAARDNTGIMGMAWEATVQMLRADTNGSCAQSDGCSFSDTAIASGIDAAVGAGARVVNLSLGGDPANAALRTAVARAAAAGLVVVVSAGNDGGSTDAGVDPANPDPFAVSLLQAGGGNVLVVGSVDGNGTVSDFSNRAGSSASSVLMAQGEQVCCVYKNGVLQTTTTAQGTFVTVVSGTSYSAPQVSGAVALLAQAFPNLTGAQIVSLLLSSARDAGASGTDAIYGRGILDIAKAFSPQGSTGLAGTQVAVDLGSVSGTAASAMGDALSAASVPTVMLDGYGRAYALDLGRGLRAAQARQPLLEALSTPSQPVSLSAEGMSLAFTVDRRFGAAPLRLAPPQAQAARVLASTMVARIAPRLDLALGWRAASTGLAARLQGWKEADFLVAGANSGMFEQPELGISTRLRLGAVGVTTSAERTRLWRQDSLRDRREDHVSRFGVALDGRHGAALDWRIGLGMMREDRTVLGARLADALGGGGAITISLSPAMVWHPDMAWQLSASASLGSTRLDRGAIATAGARLQTSSWAVDISRLGAFGTSDRIAFRLAQPLRVEHGTLRLTLPVAYDYTTGSTSFGQRTLSFSPSGREIDAEMAWSTPLGQGAFAASLYWRRQPGHVAAAPDDAGAALRWTTGF